MEVSSAVDGGNVHCSHCGRSFQAAPEVAITHMIQNPWLKLGAVLVLADTVFIVVLRIIG